jgi:hypothetical protein
MYCNNRNTFLPYRDTPIDSYCQFIQKLQQKVANYFGTILARDQTLLCTQVFTNGALGEYYHGSMYGVTIKAHGVEFN